jgi:hypothetical protein
MMRGRPAERYTTVREFGAVGNGLPTVGTPDRRARGNGALSLGTKIAAMEIATSGSRSPVDMK